MKSIIFKNQYFHISRHKKRINELVKTYDVVHFGPRVGLVLFNDFKILLTKQYRYLINSISYEIPGGSIDQDETAYKACQREAFEETGIYPTKLKKILRYYPGLDNFDNETIIFFSNNFKKLTHKYPFITSEISGLEWVDLNKCMQLIENGKILDSMTIHAIYWMNRFSK
jgi:8-oxo-dGTP pyrophosphatase MutT (NUDIX family)